MKHLKNVSESSERKQYKALLDIYRAVYSDLGVDFDSLDKEDGFSDRYSMSIVRQQLIVNRILNTTTLSEEEKQAVRSAYLSGCCPKIKHIKTVRYQDCSRCGTMLTSDRICPMCNF